MYAKPHLLNLIILISEVFHCEPMLY